MNSQPEPAASLRLVPQVAAHADEMFALLQDPALYEHEGEPPESLEWLRARFTKLESRRSADGSEEWLNWVVQLASGELVGYVQATVSASGQADLAYVLGRRHWGRGFARRAVTLMIAELVAHHGVTALSAVLKRSNARSLRLLERLGFTPAPASLERERGIEPDERLMLRTAGPAPAA